VLFFRRGDPGAVILWQRVLAWLRSAGAAIMWPHHTHIEGRPPSMAITESRGMVFCALETYLYPHTVLLKRGAVHRCAPVRSRFGWGAAHSHQESRSLCLQERQPASQQTHRVRAKRSGLLSVHRRRRCIRAECCRQAAPMVTQWGRRLACFAPLTG